MARRHLTVGQRAVIGVDLEKQYAVAADERKKAGKPSAESGQRSDAKAAKALGISRTSIGLAKRIVKEAPDLIDDIRTDKLSLNGAIDELNERNRKAAAAERASKASAAETLGDLVDDLFSGESEEHDESDETEAPDDGGARAHAPKSDASEVERRTNIVGSPDRL